LSSSPHAIGPVRCLRFGLRPTGATEGAYRYGTAAFSERSALAKSLLRIV